MQNRMKIMKIIIGSFAALVLVIASCQAVGNYSGASKEAAVKEAKAYAAELDLKNPKVSCAGYDSDGDGYLSCTILSDGQEPLQAECAGSFQLTASGCRLVKAKLTK